MKKLVLALSLVAVLGLSGVTLASEATPAQDDQQITEHHWGRGYSRGGRRGGWGHGGGWHRGGGYYQDGSGYYSDGAYYGGGYCGGYY